MSLINNAIREEICKYAFPIYNQKFLETDYLENVEISINNSLFLETLLLRIRGESIKFSSRLKKSKLEREQLLIEEIENIEKSGNTQSMMHILNDKQEELESIRAERIRGHMIRCRTE